MTGIVVAAVGVWFTSATESPETGSADLCGRGETCGAPDRTGTATSTPAEVDGTTGVGVDVVGVVAVLAASPGVPRAIAPTRSVID